MTKKVILKDENDEELIPYTSLATGAEAGRVRPDGTTLGVDSNGIISVNQGLIDTVDGKISNCVLDIPQNLKLTLENNVLTLKAGSIITLLGNTYTTVTTTQDNTLTISTDDTWVVFSHSNGLAINNYVRLNKIGSGSSLPADGTTYQCFYNSTDKLIYLWNNNQWIEWNVAYPLCIIKVENGNMSFVKDSNGNDMIFNGMGFIGHHIFIYPNINAYMPAELNPDGSLKSTKVNTNALRIIEALSGYGVDSLKRWISLQSNHIVSNWSAYKEVNHDSEADYTIANVRYYARDINLIKMYRNDSVSAVNGVPLVEYYYDGSNITSFTPRQCVRLATVDMLSDTYTKEQVDSKLANKQDTLVSGTNIKTINSTTVLGNGNFALADQSLSNLDSNGQMIVDSQNGTISNCILEIPQNIKLELSNGTVTLKAGSTIVRSGSTYQTLTTTQDTSWATTTLSNTKAVLFVSNLGYAQTLYGRYSLNSIGSGSSLPANGDTYKLFFNVTDKLLYNWDNDDWVATTHAYPLAVIEVDSQGAITGFAKDSNGNDMIFNGAGFIGHHAFVYPNVSGLTPQKFNADGTLKSGLRINTSLAIIEMNQEQYGGYNRVISLIAGNPVNNAGSYIEIDTRADVKNVPWIRQYVKNENVIVARTPNDISEFLGSLYPPQTPLLTYTYDGQTVTDFAIRQPVRTATVEMLDKVQDQVDTKLDKVTKTTDTMQLYAKNTDGSQYMINAAQQPAVNSVARRTNTGTLAVATPTADDDATNKSYVDSLADSQNGTISNCVLEIPQNIKLELSNNVLTLKAGSVLVWGGSEYMTYTTTVDQNRTYIPTSGQYGTLCLVFAARTSGALSGIYSLSHIFSGPTESRPESPITSTVYYDTTTKLFNLYGSTSWNNDWAVAYPLCAIKVDENGVMSFAKDSKGRDMIFNGAGFVGRHAFVYPNVKALLSEGFNDGGGLNSLSFTSDKLTIWELNTSSNALLCNRFTTNFYVTKVGIDLDSIDDIKDTYNWHYIKSLNMFYRKTTELQAERACLFVKYTYDGTTVTDFTIRQPYQGARNLLTTNTYKGTYDSTVQYYEGDIVKSGTEFFEALQDNINKSTANTTNWSKLSNDALVINYEKNDNTEYPIGLADANASGSAYIGPLFFTTQNKPTINASTGVITATGGVVGKTETAGDNSTKYATTAFVQTELANKFQVVTALPANPDANTFYFIVEEEENESESE